MKEVIKTSLLLILLMSSLFCFAQNQVILTYEYDDLKDGHSPDIYYWITNLGDKSIYPVYFEGFSNDSYERCKNNEVVNLFVTSTSSQWDFPDSYTIELENMKNFIFDNKKFLGGVEIKGINGRKIKMKVYYTIIDGEFCSCPLYEESSKLINYTGNIYLPISFINKTVDIEEDDLFEILDIEELVLKYIWNTI